jgi:hypothetical protein
MRTFTVTGVSAHKNAEKGKDCLGGVFKSNTPMAAAKKASRRICRICKIDGQCTIIVRIKETTPDSRQKEYVYKIRRVKKETKVVKTSPDKKKVNIVYKYVTIATSLNQFQKI